MVERALGYIQPGRPHSRSPGVPFSSSAQHLRASVPSSLYHLIWFFRRPEHHGQEAASLLRLASHISRNNAYHTHFRPTMARTMQTSRRLSEDEDFSEESEYDQPLGAPRKASRFPSRISQRHRQLDEAEEARMLRAIYGTTEEAAPACEPTGDNAKATTGSEAVSGSKTMIGSEAMTSTGELRLYLMNNCSPHCTKVCPCCKPRWSDLPTPEAEEARIAAMESTHGIINRISPKDGNKTVQIEVQNKHMKDILTSVFDGFPGFHPSLLGSNSAWIFKEPFSMFVGRWSQLLEFWACATSAEKKAWGTLVATLSPVVQPALDAIKRIKDTRLVAWDDLPLIFPPGKLMIIEQPGAVQSVVRVKEGKESYDPRGQKLYRLKYECIDWDGETYGLRTSSLDIPIYSDYKHVSMPNLRTMPLEFCIFEEDLVAKLISRGRKWSSLMGVEYKHFAGKKVPLATRTPIQVSDCGR